MIWGYGWRWRTGAGGGAPASLGVPPGQRVGFIDKRRRWIAAASDESAHARKRTRATPAPRATRIRIRIRIRRDGLRTRQRPSFNMALSTTPFHRPTNLRTEVVPYQGLKTEWNVASDSIVGMSGEGESPALKERRGRKGIGFQTRPDGTIIWASTGSRSQDFFAVNHFYKKIY